jgi:hypothetical protein
MSQPIELTGACLCNAVSINVAQAKPDIDACHCGSCQKWGGGPLLAIDCGTKVTLVPNDSVSVYDSSDWAQRGFCRHCGSHLFYRLKETQQYIMPVGLFEIPDTTGVGFHTQIFTDEKPAYYDFANQTKMMTGEEVFAAFMSQAGK